MEEKIRDIALMRRRRKRRQKILKMISFLVIIAIGINLYVNRDRWIPKLEGIGTKYHSISQSKKSKSSGNFPLIISDGVNYSVGDIDKSFAILSDAYLHIYSVDGELVDTRQHAYNSAIIETVGKKAIVYEHGGNSFRVESKHKTVYEKEIAENILFARISNDGIVAIVSSSGTYVCMLTVYDASGKEIYRVQSIERIFDLSFTNDSKGCITVTIDVDKGRMVSKVNKLSFNSGTTKWVSEQFDSFAIKSFYTSEGGVFIFGDTKCAYYDNNGQKISEYIYKDKLIGYDFDDGKVAMIFNNEQKRKNTLVTIKGPNADAIEISIDEQLKLVDVEGESVYVMTKVDMKTYNFNGKQTKSKDISDIYDRFYKMGDYFFLLGYDRIDRLDARY